MSRTKGRSAQNQELCREKVELPALIRFFFNAPTQIILMVSALASVPPPNFSKCTVVPEIKSIWLKGMGHKSIPGAFWPSTLSRAEITIRPR